MKTDRSEHKTAPMKQNFESSFTMAFVRQSLSERVAIHLKEIFRHADAGVRLPSERNLCVQLGVSRPVLRQALSILASEGLIARRWGSGSRVLRSRNYYASEN